MRDGCIRIVTWNIHAGIGADRRYNLARIIDLVRRHAPDIVALQEVDSRGRLEDLPLSALTRALGEYSAEARTIVAPDGHYGHVLISHWPMHDVRLHDLSVPRHEARFAIEAGLETPLGRLQVIAAHLGLRAGECRQQVQRLRAIVETVAGPLVLAGDFNDWHGYVRRAFLPLLPGRSREKTFPARYPLLDLDGIYCRPAGGLIRSWVDRDGRHASDHLPVIADIALRDVSIPGAEHIHKKITEVLK
ncbi:endonuclease/exonuclease/phosphatase family protein [Dongia sp.]|uniref:endonuclease/exonuclease/phosphatase family protein n=1 Tax=Dongia sp. TaxID=1977262 RepID=UPI0035B186BC